MQLLGTVENWPPVKNNSVMTISTMYQVPHMFCLSISMSLFSSGFGCFVSEWAGEGFTLRTSKF